jgi:hypothetical protein
MEQLPKKDIEKELKDYIIREVELSLTEQQSRIDQVKEYSKRYEAKRSISGLLGWGEDPKKNPKDSPWEGSSDVGIPIDAFTIEGLLPRFLKVCYGVKPVAWISTTNPQDIPKAPVVQEALNYQLTRMIKIYRRMKLIFKTVIIEGDGFAKVVWEKKTRPFNKVIRNLKHPMTGELLIDPQTQKPIEVKEDFKPEEHVLDNLGTIPEIVKDERQEEKTIYEGPMIYGRTVKELVVPKNADSPEIDEWPWICDTYKKTFDWFSRREGDPKEGKFKNIDKLWEKVIEKHNDHHKAMQEEIKVYEWHGKFDIDEDDKDEELVAFVCPEHKILLGWMLAPTAVRPFFHYQIIPMEGKPFGKGVPEFLIGLRDMIDAVFNQMIDRGSINNNPPIITPEDHEDELNPFGPGVKWKSNNSEGYKVLELPKQESMEFQKMEFLLGMVQKLFGLTDYSQPDGGGLAANRTYSGISSVIGEGNIKFDDMIRALQDVNEDLFEFIVSLNSEFLDDDFVYQLTGDKENPFKSIRKSYWQGNFDYESVGNSVNINRQLEQAQAANNLRVVSEGFGRNPAISEMTMLDATRNYFLAIDTRNIRLKPEEEIMQEKQMNMQLKMLAASIQAMIENKKASKGTAENPSVSIKKPAETMHFKDLPPSGRVQMAAKAGIQIPPEEALLQALVEHMEKAKGGKDMAGV